MSHRPPPKPPRPKHVPGKPGQPDLVIVFRYHPKTEKWNVNAVVTASPVVTSDQDTDIQIIYSLNGGPSTMLDAGAPGALNTVTFAVNPGDQYVVTQVDINVVGPSAASAALTGTVPTLPPPPPTAVPTTPGQPSIAFTP